jgi:Zn-dependent peptidase ImmA (M78 family)/transcriptional regulator with XRE-family HTH domain
MSSEPLKILGARLEARREEAQIDASDLAARARVPFDALIRFERGEGGLGVSQLARLARVLGVSEAQFFHTTMAEERAPMAPMVLLKASRGADLEDGDRSFLAQALQRARMFDELGQVLQRPRLAEQFGLHLPPERKAHEDGYRLAETVRAKLSPLRIDRLEGLGRLLEASFNILVMTRAFGRSEVSGASCRWGQARLVAVNKSIDNEGQMRFALAHELAHHLADLPENSAWADERPDQRRLWGEGSPTEKRANAFAAMFLAPAGAVAALIGKPGGSTPAITEARSKVLNVRERFGLSFTATTWHLSNLKYFDRDTADLLEQTAPDATPPSGLEPEEKYDGLQRRAFEAYREELISFGRLREVVGEEVARMVVAAS